MCLCLGGRAATPWISLLVTSPDIRVTPTCRAVTASPRGAVCRGSLQSRAPITWAAVSAVCPQGRLDKQGTQDYREGNGLGPRWKGSFTGLSAPSTGGAGPCTNLHEGISQVTSSVHHWQMAPGHDFHLQLPRHRLGFGLFLGSCRNKQASLRRAPIQAGEGRERMGTGAHQRERQRERAG